MEIASPNVLDLCNRALAEWGLKRYEDAMRSSNEALRLDQNAPTAHFVLGAMLARDPKTRREGIEHLQRAADENPAAARILEIARTLPEE
jgi:tetratricopeptide (TPR) repeat protein